MVDRATDTDKEADLRMVCEAMLCFIEDKSVSERRRQAVINEAQILLYGKTQDEYEAEESLDNCCQAESAYLETQEHNRQACEDAQAEYDSQWPIYEMPQA